MNKLHYIKEKDTLVCSYEGKMNFEDAVQQFAEIMQHGSYHDQMQMLRDFRNVELDFQSVSFDNVVDHSTSYVLTYGKVAIIVDDKVQTAFGMLFQRRVNNQPIELFNGLEAACEYLNVDAALIEPHLH